MEEKMTSGEIAKKTGVSQKAIRLYDEKGLLKPTEYSEGNYRLYDKNALLILEKIIAIKEVGFSLEEIKENLNRENSMDVYSALEQQVKLMEEKKHKLEKNIACIKNAMERCKNGTDWDSVADVMRMIQMDQGADERHFHALKYNVDAEDWYVKIYRSLNVQKNERVLDLGCGFGKLWRNNWDNIPEGVTVDAYDLHGSWADNFAEFTAANKDKLAQGTSISFTWQDIEDEAAWDDLYKSESYDRVIAHYLLTFLKDEEMLLERVANVLSEDGVFCCTKSSVTKEYFFWKDIFTKLGIDCKFIDSKISSKESETEEFRSTLNKHFSEVNKLELSSLRSYKASEDVFERLGSMFPAQKKVLEANETKLKEYLEDVIEASGELLVESTSTFWQCRK